MKRLVNILLTCCLLLAMVPAVYATNEYIDVPQDSWAADYIDAARQNGLMQGQGSGTFGYGKTVTNAEFAAMLCKIMGWKPAMPLKPTYTDVQPGDWYYQSVETAYANGAFYQTSAFRPQASITRAEMAMAFVCALGLDAAASLEELQPSAFSDVTVRKGYINVAKTIGLLEGKSPTEFKPNDFVKREEAAALLVRFYEKYNAKTDFVHGYYAISSYSQRDLALTMDAVTYQWGVMTDSGDLDTAGTVDKQLRIPDGYESILNYLDGKPKQHLGVYMDTTRGLEAMLLDPAKRTAAVASILAELNRTYEMVGKSPYSGVSIDFEGMKGEAVKQAFNTFLTELSTQLKAAGKTLYVCVPPALFDGIYYDGYDFKTIGRLADKVILMAHDYDAASLKGYEGTKWHEKMALTPIGQIYYALKQATNVQTGVEDPSKLALALSFAYVGWYIDENGKLVSATPVNLSPSRTAEVLQMPQTQKFFSQTYRNPYLIYQTDEEERIFLWYENEQSVAEKLALARCFGISGVSLWRLGTIPNITGYDVTGSYT